MSIPLPAAFATLPEFPSIGESLVFQVNGLIVVLVALTSIWGVLEVIGFCFKRAARAAEAARAQAAAAAAAQPPLTPPELAPSPITLVLIAAAVHATLGRRARVHAVLPAEASVHWAQEGRRQIFASHKVR